MVVWGWCCSPGDGHSLLPLLLLPLHPHPSLLSLGSPACQGIVRSRSIWLFEAEAIPSRLAEFQTLTIFDSIVILIVAQIIVVLKSQK